MRGSAFARRPPRPDRSEEFATFKAKPRTPASSSVLRKSLTTAQISVAIPKTAYRRDEEYRRLVSTLPCINCAYPPPSQAAHGPAAGRGLKCDDSLTFPLCATRPGEIGCHVRFDQYELFPKAERQAKALEWAALTAEQLQGSAAHP